MVDEDFRDHPLPHNCFSPDLFHLVAEVTSSNWRDDTDSKVRAYAQAGVPVYVIADREHRRVQVLSRPQDGKYQSEADYQPGEMVEIPGRVPCTIAADDLLQGA
ncbi:Uma2 family endonuclease [Streptomyces iconiensis]|uniref:Uma2 family endonuclease n=1 Tax=Streptomyces iconiensis TaxID=1384038 RepID=A0ABT6ZXI5_9ACTN|nr:Uma2 family endonuclease [Streptomyces iconiensis]MDJ1133778.1 Uma2 family endonuclease [Streptomyces iconiensis]